MIITADDFGYNQKVNREIIDAYQDKTVNQCSLLVNFKSVKDAVFQYQKLNHPHFFIGLHFNVVEGFSVSSPKEIPSIVKPDGKFYPTPLFLYRLIINKIQMKDILKELEAQIKLFKSFGLNLHHLDSHQNIHCFEPIFSEISQYLAEKEKGVKLRSILSCQKRLKKFPLKYAVFTLIRRIQSLKFPKKAFPSNLEPEEKIVHPGTNFD